MIRHDGARRGVQAIGSGLAITICEALMVHGTVALRTQGCLFHSGARRPLRYHDLAPCTTRCSGGRPQDCGPTWFSVPPEVEPQDRLSGPVGLVRVVTISLRPAESYTYDPGFLNGSQYLQLPTRRLLRASFEGFGLGLNNPNRAAPSDSTLIERGLYR